MKRQLFGIFTAMFLFMVLLPAWAYAADSAYAILYEDGTLVFQNAAAPEPGRPVLKTYEVDLSAHYSWDGDTGNINRPWDNECQSVRVVNFADKISPTSTAEWFDGCRNLERVDNISNLDTSNVTDMNYMFCDCGLTTLDLSSFDTANVTDMHGMFAMCFGLTALDVSCLDTANVTDMNSIFFACEKLTTLDVSHFNTANVTNMSGMFSNCTALTAVDVSRFDTSNVIYMIDMFKNCGALTALDVSQWDTSNVAETNSMFYGCSGLTALDVSRWNIANVTYMGSMFKGCSSLTALDLSSFDTANVISMYHMFDGCSNLKTICVSGKFVSASDDMFHACRSLVGGNGTTYNESHTDREYARIDTPSAPGYFTYKPYAPDVYAIADAVTGNGLLSVIFSNPGAATLALSYFDANGKFVSAELQSVNANAGTASFALLADAKTARVTLFDADCRPLCAYFETPIG